MTQINRIVELLEAIYQSISNLAAPEPMACKTCQLTGNAAPRILDNADVKQMLKIGDTKLYYLKKKKILKPYKLDGKDVYLESELLEAIRKSSEF